jgi:hypothetical protein
MYADTFTEILRIIVIPAAIIIAIGIMAVRVVVYRRQDQEPFKQRSGVTIVEVPQDPALIDWSENGWCN